MTLFHHDAGTRDLRDKRWLRFGRCATSVGGVFSEVHPRSEAPAWACLAGCAGLVSSNKAKLGLDKLALQALMRSETFATCLALRTQVLRAGRKVKPLIARIH